MFTNYQAQHELWMLGGSLMDDDDTQLGEIRVFLKGRCDEENRWLRCTGQQMAICQNTPLFSLLFTDYGGNGRTMFNLPNLQGKYSDSRFGIYIAVDGIYPNRDNPEPARYLGQISFMTTFPSGFVPCDGRLLPISENADLFKIYGTSFGGDGKSTFAVPKLRQYGIAVSAPLPTDLPELLR